MRIRSCRSLSASGVKLNHKNGLSPGARHCPSLGWHLQPWICIYTPTTYARTQQKCTFLLRASLGHVSSVLEAFQIICQGNFTKWLLSNITAILNNGNKTI